MSGLRVIGKRLSTRDCVSFGSRTDCIITKRCAKAPASREFFAHLGPDPCD
jgi:hypothetical protein